jgi:predicted peroxiredoxin
MPAKYIKEVLADKQNISEVEIISEFMLSFSLKSSSKKYTIYTPMSSEYLVSSDVVTKAIEKGANLVICEPWCQITGEGYKTAENGQKISVYPLKTFIKKIMKNEEL